MCVINEQVRHMNMFYTWLPKATPCICMYRCTKWRIYKTYYSIQSCEAYPIRFIFRIYDWYVYLRYDMSGKQRYYIYTIKLAQIIKIFTISTLVLIMGFSKFQIVTIYLSPKLWVGIPIVFFVLTILSVLCQFNLKIVTI